MLCSAGAALAQGIESVLAPGKLSKAHVKWEDECKQCHVKFDRTAQDRLCVECHSKTVGADLRDKVGYHGRMTAQTCRTCHTEHKGRDLDLAAFDKQRFDHAVTDFALRGGHQKAECAKCHEPARKYREAPHDCYACHKKDDVHKASLGPKCADCHTENSWKEAKFDHNKTRFPLLDKHADVKCADCHKDKNYRETPHACYACHKKDDDRKGHKGQFGEKCETCHTAKLWKSSIFNHDTETKYALRGKHRTIRCVDCHTSGNIYKVKPASDCYACHKKDDKHKESLGKECGNCHSERDWKEKAKFDHNKSAFPLLGKHVDVECKACHKSTMFKEAPKDCYACHKKDDTHKGSLGQACEKCHNERDWKTTSFDHSKTDFPLLGKHQKTECAACHKSTNYKEAPKDCYACHKKDDKHEGQQGRACGDCHDEKAWKPAPKFDHGLSKFPLLGKHVQVECKACHTSGALFKQAKSDCYSCHMKDDKHKKTLGQACETCHNARSWKEWDFDHDKRTKFALDGKHKGLACSTCHNRPTNGRVLAVAQCVSCHAKDDVHDGSYGRQCQQCHISSSFKAFRWRPGARPVGAADPGPLPVSGGSARWPS